MTLTDLLVPSFRQMLGALAAWLAKADGEGDALMAVRLAPDMFPLATQIRFACVQPFEAVSRLSDTPLPAIVAEMLDEGRNAGERPGTLADARARIDQTLAMLGALAPDALDVDPDGAIVHSLPNGMTFDFTALEYARDWALPQFTFHLMSAYAILRHAGVPLGKVDYVGHLLPKVRQPDA